MTKEIAYKDGLDAAYRIGVYDGVRDVPECPYPEDSPLHDIWWEGFSDGTEDFIQSRLD